MGASKSAFKLTRRSLFAAPLLAAPAAAAMPKPIDAIRQKLDSIPGGPALLASYPTAPALANAAFTYDNALALIALNASGYTAQAQRIGDAFLIALDHDRFWHDGRLRNGYRAGPMATPAALPGYWDKTANLWNEDAYQAGSASGNVAWAALALFHLRSPRYTEGARRLVHWLATAAWDGDAVIGGFFGEEPHPIRQEWRSTEQNLDAAVVFTLAGHPYAAHCRAFLARQFDRARGCFTMGSTASFTALDANLWPWMAFPNPDWRRSLDFVAAHFQAEGGLGFKESPDGIWTEGTAQGALAYLLAGNKRFAKNLLESCLNLASTDGYLLAAKHEIRTGLAIGPNAKNDDFRYYPWPHLGATAWAALALAEANPFIIA